MRERKKGERGRGKRAARDNARKSPDRKGIKRRGPCPEGNKTEEWHLLKLFLQTKISASSPDEVVK